MTDQLEKRNLPFDELVLAENNRPNVSMKGNPKQVRLSPIQFRLALFFKKARGNLLSHQDVADILYGEPDSDLVQENTIRVHIKQLRHKIEEVSKGRFSIKSWKSAGWYLTDIFRPNPHYPSGYLKRTK